jgi:hypothetical protein
MEEEHSGRRRQRDLEEQGGGDWIGKSERMGKEIRVWYLGPNWLGTKCAKPKVWSFLALVINSKS